MFNRKYKMVIRCIEYRIGYYRNLAMWAKQNRPDRYDMYINRVVALKEVLQDIEREEVR